MNTIVKNWHIVSVFDGDALIGKVLWGICVDDMTYRFATDDYISTSKIVEISPQNQLIKTASGNLYQVLGEGQKTQVQLEDFELLRIGFSPEQIRALNSSSSLLAHQLWHQAEFHQSTTTSWS